MNKILVPCDFSEPAVEAFKFAVDLAARKHGEVVVLKVIDMPFLYETSFRSQPVTFNPNFLKELVDDAKKNYESLVEEYAGDFRNIKFYVEHGSVISTIRQYIETKGIDLVVMGTQGTIGLTGFFIGSNTEKIVRTSVVPVIAVRNALPSVSVKNILFPTSIHLNHSGFIQKLKELQAFFNATLHVLHVNTPFNFIRERDLEAFAKRNELVNYTVNIRNDKYEYNGILDFALEKQTELIAMATHGRSGLAHMFNGSIAEDVVNRVSCPIWTYAIKKQS